MNNQIGLGTVQFGRAYGIANRGGQVDRNEVSAILDYAWNAGVDTLDTAMVYGDSERILGEIGVSQWRVISKLSEVPELCPDVSAWVQESVVSTLERLDIPVLRALLLHNPQQLFEQKGETLYEALVMLKKQGLVEKIGVSIYNPEDLDSIWSSYKIDIVQAPFNIIDRRLTTSGWLTRLNQSGTEIHIRSVFLQGLLLMNDDNRPEFFNRWKPLWKRWSSWLTNHNLTALQASLNFANSQQEIDRIIIGVDSLQHLQEIIVTRDAEITEFPDNLECEDLTLINPSNWKKYEKM
jgi:aryl-alcohol dehydrogenase-like predicted oxidoreductase